MKKSHFILFAFLIASVGSIVSQQLSPHVVSPSGGFYSNSSGMLSFTTGEMTAVETYTNTNILTQGFQQVWDFGTDVKEQPGPDFSFSVHPNPSDGFFRLVSESTSNEHVSVRILDVLGREIQQSSFNHQGNIHVQYFDLSCAAQGMYFIAMTVEETNASGSPRQFVKKIKIVR